MAENETRTTETEFVHETANDRFKRSFGNWFWGSLIAATVLHFLLFLAMPSFNIEDIGFTPEELEAIELPPEVEIPPPPEQIARPATPVIAEAELEEDITIAPTTFEENPIENLPPPPSESGDLSAAPTFTPMTVRPTLRNQAEVQRALMRYYPPLLRDNGIEGTVKVWFFINEGGRVVKTQVAESSGYDQFDDAALRVADIMEFSPALNRDKKVPVWVSIPIQFQIIR